MLKMFVLTPNVKVMTGKFRSKFRSWGDTRNYDRRHVQHSVLIGRIVIILKVIYISPTY